MMGMANNMLNLLQPDLNGNPFLRLPDFCCLEIACKKD